ncbi:MAG: DMT family transporter [Yoonia sp.]|uniref:DMT family transporter n=1 Tax=Yoonia sp. TaxID=2212373 RepID=UPI00273D7AB5|nr:DMT family transporter [Yoonia sp.]MDP5086500.1 DMT family transporter [Yoonia sp.]MDP5360445.1 DMT family transporter [Paracoccaceae bacterium]MDP5362684.1 DMT family transporter [Paracoccaceae bacterium]
MSPNARGALFALLAFGVFATHDVIVKILGGIYSPFQIVFFSVLLSFPLAAVMLMRDAKPGTLMPVHPWWMTLRTGAAVVTGVSAFYAFSVLPLAQVYAILFAAPLLITVLAIPVLGETVRLRRWMAVIVGLIGVLVVLRPGQTELSAGHIAALAAAVGGSIASIVVRKIGNEERPVVMMLHPMIANFVLMGCALPFVYQPMPIEHLGMLGVIAVFAWIASRLVIAAYQAGEAAIIAPMQYSQIVWATGFGLLFFDERIDMATGIGAGIIIASGMYIVLRESRIGTSENTPVLRTRSRSETGTTPRVSLVMRIAGKKLAGEKKP